MSTWTTIPSYPDYQVNTFGDIRNRKTGLILKQFSDRYGYMRVSLGSINNVYVHRIVCETFYGLPEGVRCHVNHIDGDRKNNNVLNLEWCTPSENIKWGVMKGNVRPAVASQRAAEINARPVRIVELDKVFSSVRACADFLNVPPTNVSRCLVGNRKGQRIHGYHVEFTRERGVC